MLMRNASAHAILDDSDAEYGMQDRRASGANASAARDPRMLLTVLRWRAPLIAGVIAATVIAAGAITFVLPPKYKATTVVLVDPRQPRVTNTEAVISGIGSDAAAVESQVELIESSSLARKVIARLKLDQDPDFVLPSTLDQITDSVRSLFRRPTDDAERQVSRLVSRFQKSLSVKRRGLTYILEIHYWAGDPTKAARISTALAEAYLEDQRQAKSDMTARASGWLGDRIEEMRDRVRAADQAVAAYKASHNIIDVTQGNKLVNRQIEDLTQQLALARARTADARGRLERVQQVSKQVDDPAALSESLQSQVISNLRSQFAEAARVEAEYNALYGSKYPGLVAVRAQIADIRRQIESELTRIVTAIRAETQVAVAREAALESELNKLKTQSATASEASVKLQELEREAQANRLVFEQFLNRAKETAEQQGMQMPDARIVSPALIPLKPDRPPTLLLLLAAALCGGVLGVGLVLLIEQMRRGIRTMGDVEELLSLPTIGVFPSRPKARKRGRVRKRASAPRGATLDAAVSFDAALRAARARLRQTASRPDSDVLIVASALQGEGKSTFACHYALSCASAGIRTLLIDADLLNRSTTRAFGITGSGIGDVLHGRIPLDRALKKEPKSGLSIIGAGPKCDDARDIEDLNGLDLDAFVRSCREQFDLVVIDSPAILPIGGNVPFMHTADRAVLVVEWDRTERRAVLEAVDMLGGDAGKLAGVVLNKVALGWYRLFGDSRYMNYFEYAAAQPGEIHIRA